jgi:DNA primase
LDELRERADIVSVVSEYVTLKQSGRRYWGLCPFHHEKTASFSVDGDRQVYYCFGCKAGGSVIQFVMEMERLAFPEAVHRLAEKVRMPLPERLEDAHYERLQSEKARIYEANRAAAQWFHSQLWAPQGAPLLSYLHGRGLDDAAIRRFGLGAAPDAWDALTQALAAQGYTPAELVRAGLAVDKNQRAYDMFRGRAMFPIINAGGQVLGFGGRAMGDAQPKYLNTADTPVFNKRLGLYGVHLLRKVRDLSRVILVEGYMDVASLVQRGVTGVLATLGTALTVEQARLMKRYAPQVWLAYDGDAAGQKAIHRGLDLLEEEAVPAKVLVFPDGQDPDEFIRACGLEAFEALRPMDPATYRMDALRPGYDLSQEEGRVGYAKACAEVLRKVREPVELENHLRHLSIATGFSHDVLLQQVGQQAVLAPKTPARPRNSLAPAALPDHVKAERSLLALLCAGRIAPQVLSGLAFTVPLHRVVAERLFSGQSASAILEQAEDDAQRRDMAEIFGLDLQGEADQALEIAADCLLRIHRHSIQQRIAEHSQALPGLDGEARQQAMAQIHELMQELNRLKQGRKEGSV